jgi:uroporphyrinogen decarboxylase
MTRREVIIDALEFRRPAYVPWAWGPTHQCAERMKAEGGIADIGKFCGSHLLPLPEFAGQMKPVGNGRFRDPYGVIWDRSVDHDIGTPEEWPIRRPEDLDSYGWPAPPDEKWYANLRQIAAKSEGRYVRYGIGFSLFERAWTMRGMTELLMDMVERPEFVEKLMDRIVDFNMIQIHEAIKMGVDGVYFGDDYGMQQGLIMGAPHWRHFIKPRLKRMFEPVRNAGKHVFLHSCGDVDELFDDLVEIGLNNFNPFQPEAMDVFALKKQYHGRLSFHGGLSIQKTLPFGTVEDVRRETQALIDMGRDGGYICSPSHAVPYDVPPENLKAMMEVLRAQPGVPAGT